MNFRDHFSAQAADYAKFRPHYPTELFDYLSDIAPDNEIAWDCATGNGQAAVALASKFRNVIATDASEKQIKNAARHERIDYRRGSQGHDERRGAGSGQNERQIRRNTVRLTRGSWRASAFLDLQAVERVLDPQNQTEKGVF